MSDCNQPLLPAPRDATTEAALQSSVSLSALDRSQIEPRDREDEPTLGDPEVFNPAIDTKDEDDEAADAVPAEPDAPLTASAAFARAALNNILPRNIRRAIRRGDPVVVVVETPTAGWIGPLSTAIDDLSSRSIRKVIISKAPYRYDQPVTPCTDSPVIAVTSNPDWLPLGVLDAADLRLRLRITPAMVEDGLRLALGRAAAVTQRDVTGLDLPDLTMAVRAGSSAASCVRRMRRTAERRSVVHPDDTTPKLGELKGYGPAMVEIETIVDEARNWIASNAIGAPPPSLLLHGRPGTGKTLVARSIGKTLGLPFIQTSVPEWFSRTNGDLGDVTKAAQIFFDKLSAAAPAIGFIDEIDGLPDRASLSDRGRDWWTLVVVGVLLMIDRIRAERPSVILVAATNHIDRLDAALKRHGRFDRHIEIRPPETVEELTEVVRHHLGDDLRDHDIASAARLGLGATGADVEAWVTQARQRAYAASRAMTLTDLVDVIAPPDSVSPELRQAIALHEAAHAVVGLALGRKLLSVSIVSKGSTGGVTTFADERTVLGREDLERRVKTTLAGRAADILFSGGATTGAGADLRQATALVVSIHASFGLGCTLIALDHESAADAIASCPDLRRLVAEDLDRLMEETIKLVSSYEIEVRRLAMDLIKQRYLVGDAGWVAGLKRRPIASDASLVDQ